MASQDWFALTLSLSPRRGSARSPRREKPPNGGRFAGLRKSLPPHESGAPVSDPARWGLVYRKPRRVGDRRSVQRHTERTSAEKSLPGERAGVGERLIPPNSYSLVGCRSSS